MDFLHSVVIYKSRHTGIQTEIVLGDSKLLFLYRKHTLLSEHKTPHRRQLIHPGHIILRERNTRVKQSSLESLPCLLGTDQCNDPRQLRALLKLIPLDVVIGFAGSDIRTGRQHSVLKRKHLGKEIVEKRSRELDPVGIGIRKSDLKLAWRLPSVDLWLLVYISWSVKGD